MFRPTPAVLGAFRATSRVAFNKPAFQPHFGSVYVSAICGVRKLTYSVTLSTRSSV